MQGELRYPKSGLAVMGNPDSTFTVIWGETDSPDGPAPPGRVQSATRATAGTWSPQFVADVPNDIPGRNINFGSPWSTPRPPPTAYPQLALWQEGAQMSVVLRDGPESAWGPTENAGGIPGSQVPRPTAPSLPAACPSPRGPHRSPAALPSGRIVRVERGIPSPSARWCAAAHRPTPSSWRSPGRRSGDALDGVANTAAAWPPRPSTPPRRASRRLRSPGSGSTTFSAAADDNWLARPAFRGRSGCRRRDRRHRRHAYGGPGTFTATATATDAVGNAAQQSGPVTVTQTPPPANTAPPSAATPTRTASPTASTTTTAPRSRCCSRPSTRPSSPARSS